MTNFEYYKDEIQKCISNKIDFAVRNGKIENCIDIRCDDCIFDNILYRPCEIGRLKWLYEEHKETPKLTAREYSYLNFLKDGYMVYYRDKFGEDIRVYYDRPIERRGLADKFGKWHGKELKAIIDINMGLFSFVKADDKPYRIEEMLTWEHEEE